MRPGAATSRLAWILAAAASAACGVGAAVGDGGPAADAHEAFHASCVAKVNSLRATRGLPALARWRAAEACVDQLVTADQASNDPHGTIRGGGSHCGSSQNECLGGGAAYADTCLDSMWAERLQPGCAGWDACASAPTTSCPGCDFYGTATGDVCGHYVNMSAGYFTMVACGVSAAGGWTAMNFQ
jgi:hypothetical protein